MSCTAEMIATLRRMIGESSSTTYSDADLETVVEKYPLIDANGFFPDNDDDLDDWDPTYDLNAAAAEIWGQKAAAVAGNFDFSADGATFHRSQEFDMMTRMATFYKARRSMKATRLISSPKEEDVDEKDLSN